jgi:hypothetical protein
MQRLSMNMLAVFTVLALSGAGFAKAPAAASPTAPASLTKATFDASYYFYSAFDGTYNDYATVSWEIWEMEIDYDVLVDQTPGGGTLVERGYWYNNPNYPVMVFLYAHFD